MEILEREINAQGFKLSAVEDSTSLGFAYLYILKNVHDRPFGLIEYVFVKPEHRRQGAGQRLTEAAIDLAKRYRCYKVILTTRYGRDEAAKLYEKLGFQDWGREYRMDIT